MHPLKLKCPGCGARPGKPCVRKGVEIATIHKSRRKRARLSSAEPAGCSTKGVSPRAPFVPFKESTTDQWVPVVSGGLPTLGKRRP